MKGRDQTTQSRFQLPSLQQVLGHLLAKRPTKKTRRGCRFAGCKRYAKSKGFCIAHGGGYRCMVDGCNKHAKYRGLCISHGGRRLCSVVNCTKHARQGGVCAAHRRTTAGFNVEGYRRSWMTRQLNQHPMLSVK